MQASAPRRAPGAPSSTVGGASEQALCEVRLVGRGGQGVVTAGELLGEAVMRSGRSAQSIPTFGPERRGAMAACTLRISDQPIQLKCSTARPRVLLCLDPTIWRHAPTTLGLQEGALLLVNTKAPAEELEAELRSGRYPSALAIETCTVRTLDATGIAIETIGRTISNTTMLGALAGATDLVTLADVEGILRERFAEQGEANVAAARAGHACMRGEDA